MRIFSIIAAIFLYFEIFSRQTTGYSTFTTVCNNRVLSSGETGGICYNISDVTATWHVANATCVSNGGRLAKIFNRESRDEIIRITDNRNGTEDYWIGLKRVGDTSQYQWTDGTNLTYNEWSSNIPMQGYDCVGVKGNSSNLVSLDCNNSNYYICETDVCNGWRVRNGICYKRFEFTENNKVDWYDAIDHCNEENAYLAEIPNIYVTNIINDMLVGATDYHCLIGFSTDDDRNYNWRIGDFPLGPKSNYNDESKCGVIGLHLNERKWELKPCNNKYGCAFCMKGPLTIGVPEETCSGVTTNGIIDRGSCYRRIEGIPRELHIAYLTCNSYNGTLYTFNDTKVNMRLHSSYINPMGRSFWLQNPNQYSLADSQVGYFNLVDREVTYSDRAQCQILTEDGITIGDANSGSEEGDDCEDISDEGDNDCKKCEVNYICKIDYVPNPRILNRTSINDTCYWSVTGNRNWAEAETECVTEGGHLVEIFNEATQLIIVSLIATKEEYLDELYWIGIGDYVNSSSQWRSGTSICYNNFSINATTTSDSICVAIDKNGKWIISNCENKYSFVCGKNVIVGDNSPCPNPTTNATPMHNITLPANATILLTNATILPTNATNTQNKGCSPDWTNTDGICYKVFEGVNINWDSAQTMCMSFGGYLAEFPNFFVQTTITNSLSNQCWIGLRRNGTNFQWRSGRELNEFQFWGDDDPGTEDCVSVNGEISEWITKSCSDLINCYICMNGYSTITTVCNNRVLHSKTGGICYNISDVTATWHVANATCVSNGGRLAKIFNSRSRDEIIRITDNRNGTEDYWIGLKRVGDTSQYEWTDGTNVTYNEWYIDNPMQGYDCVGVKRWDWSLINCTDSHFYICETDVCNGWRVRNGTCYKKFVGNTTWNKAVRLCEAENAYLAEIPNMFSNDIINYLIQPDECWIGLSTNVSDYSWRIGNFSLSDPTKAVALNESDTNKCGTIGMNYGHRWGLEDCNVNQTCAVCMKGPLTSEYPINYCTNLDKAIVDRGICYRRNVKRANELDLAILTCNRFNGELYKFDDNATNYRLISKLDSLSTYSTKVYPKEFNEQSNLFTPQHGYFNLLTSNENLTTPVNCQNLTDGVLQHADCSNVNFICKIEYEPYQVTLQRNLSNDTRYWSVTGNRNWTEAETECVTEGGHLVEILNEATQLIIVSLIATEEEYLDELYWIGIGEYVCYNNFSINAAIISDSACVAIDKNGKWTISNCENKYSFVCGKNVIVGDNSPCPNPTTNATILPTNVTILPTNATILPTNVTILPTNATILPTNATILPTNATILPTNVTILPTNATILPTNVTILPTNATILPTNATNTQNKDAINCNENTDENQNCATIQEINATSFQEIEEFSQNVLDIVNVTTGIILEYKSDERNADVVVIGYNQSQFIRINIGTTILKIPKGSFPGYTTLIITSYDNTIININVEQILTTGQQGKIVSDVITIVASENLTGELTIVFSITGTDYILKEGESLICSSFTPDGKWSDRGIQTDNKCNGTVVCITNHLTTFAVLAFTANSNRTEEIENILDGISYTLLTISLLFLMTSIGIFIMSGKVFFSIDINVLHFNLSLSLLVGVSCFLFVDLAKYNIQFCTTIAFLLHFLWTNVFLSSLALGILVFYSICVVSIEHTARKLSKFLIPISWLISISWALVWLIIGISKEHYIDIQNKHPEPEKQCNNNTNNTNNTQIWTCFISKETNLVWAFIIPMFIILLINALLLAISLYKIRLALKKRDNSVGELKTLRKVAFGGVSLIPALSLYFISSLPLAFSSLYKHDTNLYTVFEFVYIISTTPIGIFHFIFITCQLTNTVISEYWRRKEPQTSINSINSANRFLPKIGNSINRNTNTTDIAYVNEMVELSFK